MNQIAGIPYSEATFAKDAKLIVAPSVPPGTTDLLVISHGWRNDRVFATSLYQNLFTNFAAAAPAWPAGRKAAIVGVFWPSANFDFLMAGQPPGDASGTAGANEERSDAESRQKLKGLLEDLKNSPLADDNASKQALAEAQALIPDLDDKASARVEFLEKLRSVMGTDPAPDEDASAAFREDDPEEVFRCLEIPAVAVDPEVPRSGGALAIGAGGAPRTEGEAAGLLDIFKGVTASAANAVSYLTYYKMKERAGLVGEKGLAPLLDQLAAHAERIHLIGHSFGARLVSAAALRSTTPKLWTLSLLQAAFSHNGFSAAMNGYFRAVVANKRVSGPVLITHTKNDRAVGMAYPLASRLSRANNLSFGDENDQYGGLGRNGAQQMGQGEVIRLDQGAAAAVTALKPGAIHNVLADAFVQNHGDVENPTVAGLVKATVLAG